MSHLIQQTEPEQTTITTAPGSRAGVERTVPQEAGIDIEAVLAAVTQEGNQRRRRQRSLVLAASSIVAVVFIAFLINGVIRHRVSWDMLASLGGMSALIGIAAGATQKHKSAALALARLDDLRAVGPLVDTLEMPDHDLRQEATTALTRLLPKLQASDADLLNSRQRGILIRALNRAYFGLNPEFATAILKACGQVGGAAEITTVERLAGKAPGGSRIPEQVAEAARECLPAMRERVELGQAERQLLRGASAESLPGNGLLRPAQGGPKAGAETLLRAHQPDTEV